MEYLRLDADFWERDLNRQAGIACAAMEKHFQNLTFDLMAEEVSSCSEELLMKLVIEWEGIASIGNLLYSSIQA